jgi:hypothetical protein
MNPKRLAAFVAPSILILAMAAPAWAAPGKSIRFGQTIRGELKAGDPKAEDDSLFDLYRFTGKKGERIVLEMNSKALDSFLAIYVGEGVDPIDYDDDGGGGNDARLVFTLPQDGTYQVRANAVKEDEKGAYTLKLSRAPALVAANVTSIALGGRSEGDLTSRDAQADDDSYYDVFRFSGAKGDRIAVELKSRDFDAYLSIHKPGEKAELGYDDDGGKDGDARLVFVLPQAGEYDIRANSLSKGETGHYTLSLDKAEAALGPISIAYGDSPTGRLDIGDAKADDASFYDVYRFRGMIGDKVVITMRSNDVDSYVSLHAKDRVDELAADDDGLRQGADSMLTFTLPSSGEFDIWANTLKPGETGTYELRLERNGRAGGIIA